MIIIIYYYYYETVENCANFAIVCSDHLRTWTKFDGMQHINKYIMIYIYTI